MGFADDGGHGHGDAGGVARSLRSRIEMDFLDRHDGLSVCSVHLVRAAVLTIGDELLRGDIVDTNAAFLCARLFAAGADVVAHASRGDAPEAIEGAPGE